MEMAKDSREMKVKEVVPTIFSGAETSYLDDLSSGDFSVPFLRIVNTKDDDSGAKPGEIVNSVTGEIHDEINVIPVHYMRRFYRWGPRASSGELEAIYTVEDIEGGKIDGVVWDGFRAWVGQPLPPGAKLSDTMPTIVDTRTFLVLLIDKATGGVSPATISMKSTGIAKAKAWLSMQRMRRGVTSEGEAYPLPPYSTIYTMRTQHKIKGQFSWYTPIFSFAGTSSAEQVAVARSILSNLEPYIRGMEASSFDR